MIDKDGRNVELSQFGTLIERMPDPAKRSPIGAHFAKRVDNLTPLRVWRF